MLNCLAISSNRWYCSECGYNFFTTQNEKTCDSCGFVVDKDTNFCSECGESLLTEQINTTVSTSEMVEYSILDLGQCNDNIAWEIRSNGELYIYGQGSIPHYETSDDNGVIAPWRESPVFELITDITIAEGITGVGKNALMNLQLSSISFGPSMIVFNYSKNLWAKTVYIPTSMESEGVEEFLSECYYAIELFGNLETPTIYYEGTEEAWMSMIKSWNSSLNNWASARYAEWTVYDNYDWEDGRIAKKEKAPRDPFAK